MKTIKHTLMAASAFAMMGAAAPASAATFILNGLSSISNLAARQGFQTAANYWANTLTDDVTVRFNVAYAALNPGVLGSTSSNSAVYSVSSIYGALFFDASSALDVSAATTLDPLGANGNLTMITPGYLSGTNGIDTANPTVDADVTGTNANNNRFLAVNTANAKALGDTSGTAADASITFSSNFNFDFNPSDGITAGQYDFIGVAIHEMGHALGFVSGVDTYDVYGQPNCDATTPTHCLDGTNLNQYAIGSTLDLFRYSAPGDVNWNPGTEVYMSVDGGLTELYGESNFSTGRYNGDGNQASHWKAPGTCNQAEYIGILNPYLCSGQTAEVRSQDLGALDAIGWDLAAGVRDNATYSQSTAQIFAAFGVPEPATWLQLILGFGVIGGAYRSARRRKVSFAAA